MSRSLRYKLNSTWTCLDLKTGQFFFTFWYFLSRNQGLDMILHLTKSFWHSSRNSHKIQLGTYYVNTDYSSRWYGGEPIARDPWIHKRFFNEYFNWIFTEKLTWCQFLNPLKIKIEPMFYWIDIFWFKIFKKKTRWQFLAV